MKCDGFKSKFSFCVDSQVTYDNWCDAPSVDIAGRGKCANADPNNRYCLSPDSCNEKRPFVCRGRAGEATSDDCMYFETVTDLDILNCPRCMLGDCSNLKVIHEQTFYQNVQTFRIIKLICLGLLGHTCKDGKKCVDTAKGPKCVRQCKYNAHLPEKN